MNIPAAPETPPSGQPRLAAPGHALDNSSSRFSPGSPDSAEIPWLHAAGSLTVELHSRGLAARTDPAVGAVNAIGGGPAHRVQQAVLRPHRGRLWWWLRHPGESGPALCPLTPAADPAGAARRIVRLLAA
ncbi:hypothetical protein CLV63_106125 [Murinocardiopsis flavida]|uniref:Uncharacterized protein n=1 Tax=Murinocardiopsis flavida TaxID=645275 RepID=A0A2P8DLK8_9ACTN|nr:hypothetical protein [Murinocardiopsis flavida]PSK98077.1 hypothetical protein CLV63_106125 [Murinocardiopsis flavida]